MQAPTSSAPPAAPLGERIRVGDYLWRRKLLITGVVGGAPFGVGSVLCVWVPVGSGTDAVTPST